MDDPDTLKHLAGPLGFTSVVASAGGLALMLRHNRKIRTRDVVMTVFASSAAGTIVFLLLYGYLIERNTSLLYGVSALSGVGGASSLELLLLGLRTWAEKKGYTKE